MRFNPLDHVLVPEHRLLSQEEADEVLKRLKVTRDQLPKIRKTDPVIRLLERVHACSKCGGRVALREAPGKAPRACVGCRQDEVSCTCDRSEKGPIEEGSIIRVLRLTPTAGVSEAYRLVIGR